MPVPRRVHEEAALAAEQVLEAAPLRVELDARSEQSQEPARDEQAASGRRRATTMSPGRFAARRRPSRPRRAPCSVVMKSDSPPSTLRLSDFISPPVILASSATPSDVAIMAPGLGLDALAAWRGLARATAKLGAWRTVISMDAPGVAGTCVLTLPGCRGARRPRPCAVRRTAGRSRHRTPGHVPPAASRHPPAATVVAHRTEWSTRRPSVCQARRPFPRRARPSTSIVAAHALSRRYGSGPTAVDVRPRRLARRSRPASSSP